MMQTHNEFILRRQPLQWLLLSLAFVIAPHLLRLPFWVPLSFFVLALWRYLTVVEPRKWPLPRGGIRVALMGILLLGVLLHHHTLFGRDAGVALLVGLIGLKLMEMNSRRDVSLISLLAYFLVITNFLYSQSIPVAIYLFLVTILITGTLISFSDLGDKLSVTRRLRLATTLLLQALPLMLVLFVLFPRVEGPFWGLPKDAHSGVSGLNETMTLGEISQLTLSDEIAFRVRFENNQIPPAHDLYWRGPVLWWSDGRTWKGGFLSRPADPLLETVGEGVKYTVTLEPHNQSWMFALEMPAEAPPIQRGFMTSTYQIQARREIRQRMRYSLTSHLDYKALEISERQRRIATYLPDDHHPRTRELARQWKSEENSPGALVDRALAYFNQQAFVYTLQPPRLLQDPVDQFLFDTRRGFCEHYAAAFTVLMRAAEVPARIVTGYQGGDINPLGNYLVVRQRDAHAWSEVWLEDEGWVRVDPTGAVSPNRVEQGIDTALPPEFRPLGFQVEEDSLFGDVWKQMGNTWDALNNTWNDWVLGYGPEYQNALLDWLGLGGAGYRGMALLLMGLLALMLTVLGGWLLWHNIRPYSRDPVQRQYQRFCARLARHGLPRRPWEGPHGFGNRAAARFPELAGQIQEIIRLYVELRYHAGNRELIQPLTVAVRHFRP